MTNTENTFNHAIIRRIETDIVVFVGKPTLAEVNHLKGEGFKYDKGQWVRSKTASDVQPSASVFEYGWHESENATLPFRYVGEQGMPVDAPKAA